MAAFQNSTKCLCFLFLAFLALPASAQEGREDYSVRESDYSYVKIGEDRTGSVSMLYLPSVERRRHDSGEYVAGWVKYVYSDAGAAELASGGIKPFYSMDFYAANKDLRQIQALSSAVYDKDGRIISTTTRPFNSCLWEECIPNTNGEAVWLALMKAAGYTGF